MLYFETGEIIYTEHIRQKPSRYITAPGYGDDDIDPEVRSTQVLDQLTA